MNTDIEEIRLLSVQVANIFCDRITLMLGHSMNNKAGGPYMVAVVYQKALDLLQLDEDIAVATRAEFLKTLSNRFLVNNLSISKDNFDILPKDKKTEMIVDVLWEEIEKVYNVMLLSSKTLENNIEKVNVESLDERTGIREGNSAVFRKSTI